MSPERFSQMWYRNRNQQLSAFILLAVCGFSALNEAGTFPSFSFVTGTLLGLFILMEWSRIHKFIRLVPVGALIFSIFLVQTNKISIQTVSTAIDRAAFFAFFFTGFSILREAASSSALVHKCGLILMSQPPGRRYMSMTLGSHLLGILLNFGALNVLGVTIQNQLKPENEPQKKAIRKIRVRRMFTAVQRGIAAISMWSPTSFTMVLIFTGLPELSWSDYVPIGMVIGVLFLLWGALLDKLLHPKAVQIQQGTFKISLFANLLALFSVIPAMAFLIVHFLPYNFLVAMILSSTVCGIGWMVFQGLNSSRFNGFSEVKRRFFVDIPEVFTAQRNEISLVGFSAFIGILVVPLIDPVWVQNLLLQSGFDQAWLLICIGWVIVLGSFVGMNPVVTVTILLGLVRVVPELGFPPVALIAVISVSWAVMITVSPLAAAQMLTSRLSGTPVKEIVIHWNGLFAISTMLAMDILLILLL